MSTKADRSTQAIRSFNQAAVPRLVASTTCAIASMTFFSLPNEAVPTYVANTPSELISSIFQSPLSDTNHTKLLFSLRSYNTFEDDWDGYGGKAASKETIDDVISFLKKLPTDFSLPYSGLSGDGEISLFWDKDCIFIDIGFTGKHSYSYYARNSDGQEYFGNDIQISSGLSNDLVKTLRSINT